MLKNRRSYKRISQVAVASLLTGLGVYAQAADLYLTANNVTITGSGGTNSSATHSATVGSNGILTDVTDVPLVANMGLPSFAFTLNTSGATDGTYRFRVGVTIDDNASDRRMEAKLETLELAVSSSGAVINGSIPNQTLRVLGRDGSGTVTVAVDLTNAATNGPIQITGGQIKFDAEALIAKIKASNAGLTTIVNEFSSASQYTYRIVVQQTSGPTTLNFGHTGTSFSAFPKIRTTCSLDTNSQSSSVFVLLSNEMASSFSEAYAVQGQFNVLGGSTTFGTLAAFTDSCGTTSSGGTTTTPPVQQTTTEVSNSISAIVLPPAGSTTEVPAATQTQINNVVDSSATLASNTADQIAAGTATTTVALTALDTASNALETAGAANTIGATINMTSAVNTVNNIANALSNLTTGRELTAAEITSATNIVLSTIESSVKLIDSTTTPAQVNSLISANIALLGALVKESQTVPATMVTQAQTLATTALKSIATSLPTTLTKGVDFNNTAALTTLLSSSPTLTQRAINTSVKVPDATKPAPSSNSLTAFSNALSNPQIATQARTTLTQLVTSRFNIDSAALTDITGARRTVADILRASLNGVSLVRAASATAGLNVSAATGDTATADSETGTIAIKVGSANVVAVASAARLVPSSVATGISSLPDGRTLIVESGVAIDLAPTTVNTLGFTAAVFNAGFTPSFRENGSVGITLNANETFSGAFAYDSVGSTTASTCGAVSFEAPTGSPAAASYAFVAKCANGTTQRITPFAADATFYTTLANAGLEATTDRNSGTVNIANVGKFKPSFFVKALTDADSTYLTANKNADGVAFRAKESNGDGKMDYEFITSTGVQVLYGM